MFGFAWKKFVAFGTDYSENSAGAGFIPALAEVSIFDKIPELTIIAPKAISGCNLIHGLKINRKTAASENIFLVLSSNTHTVVTNLDPEVIGRLSD